MMASGARAVIIGAVAACALLAAPAGQAAPGSASVDSVLRYSGSVEANDLTIEPGGDGYVLRDALQPITAGAGCRALGPNEVTCTVPANVQQLAVSLYGGDDKLDASAVPFKSTITTGAGEDDVTAGTGADTIIGAESGEPEADTLRGGPGDDSLRGDGGNDVLDGGAGTDLLVFSGTEGDDTIAASDSFGQLQAGTGTQPYEGGIDTYSGIERFEIFGSGGDDSISGASGEDRLFGGAGDDTLSGAAGADLIVGDAGNDTMAGGAGDDLLSTLESSDRADGQDGSEEYWVNWDARPLAVTVADSGTTGSDRLRPYSFFDSTGCRDARFTRTQMIRGSDTITFSGIEVFPCGYAHRPPSVTTLGYSTTGPGAVNLSGVVATYAQLTVAYFDYGLTAAYGSRTADQTVTSSVTASISGLTPGATYHYRLVASNDFGTSFGEDRSFVVPRPAAPKPPVRCHVPNVKRMTVARARGRLLRAQCAIGRIRRVYSRKVRKGRVISTTPRAGAVRPRNTRVSMLVSRGPKRRR